MSGFFMSIGSLDLDATTAPPINRARGTGDVSERGATGGCFDKGASGRSGTCSGKGRMEEVSKIAGTSTEGCDTCSDIG